MEKGLDIKGHTLLEVLIALVISLIITIGVTKFFIFQHRIYLLQEEMTETSQTLRNIVAMVSREIILAGYGIPGGMTKILKSLDRKIVFRANLKDIRFRLASTAIAGERTLFIDKNSGGSLRKNNRVIICNDIHTCEEHTLYENSKGNSITLSSPLSQTFSSGSTISLVNTISYRYNREKRRIERKIDRGQWQSVSENIPEDGFILSYKDENNQITHNTGKVKRIDMHVAVKAGRSDKKVRISKTITLRN